MVINNRADFRPEHFPLLQSVALALQSWKVFWDHKDYFYCPQTLRCTVVCRLVGLPGSPIPASLLHRRTCRVISGGVNVTVICTAGWVRPPPDPRPIVSSAGGCHYLSCWPCCGQTAKPPPSETTRDHQSVCWHVAPVGKGGDEEELIGAIRNAEQG